MKAIGIFVITAICEIAGCYAVFGWLRLGKPAWWLVPGAVSLAALIFSYPASFSECGLRLCRVWGRLYCRVAAVAVDG